MEFLREKAKLDHTLREDELQLRKDQQRQTLVLLQQQQQINQVLLSLMKKKWWKSRKIRTVHISVHISSLFFYFYFNSCNPTFSVQFDKYFDKFFSTSTLDPFDPESSNKETNTEPTQKEQNVDSTRFPEISSEKIEELKAVASSTKQWKNVFKS